ncbi:MAG TPA: VCBS repeat-containing protein [Solirubrobacterales bacterium]|nr:VCBS repeat-containing protein [Solirubrobacterales bacterium]
MPAGRRRAALIAGAVAVLALAGAIAVLVLVVSGDSDGGSGRTGDDGGSGGSRDPSARVLRDADGEAREIGRDLGVIEVTESERLGIRALELGAEAGLQEYTRTHGALALDFDDDGDEDVLVNRHYFAPLRLYRNNGDGTFADVTGELIPRSERDIRDPHGCAAADVNRNGRLDIYCTTGGAKGREPNPAKLWIQQADGTFRDRTDRFGVADPFGRGREAAFIDANGDGYPDLFHGTTYPREDGEPTPNRLFINEGGERFREAPEFGLEADRDVSTVDVADYDGDGYEDLLVCGSDGLFLFRNVDGERFEDVAAEVGLDVPRCPAAAFGRFDRDRDPDIVYATRTAVHVGLQEDGEFADGFELEVSDSRRVAVGDVNGDGLDDVFVLRSGKPDADFGDLLLVNRGQGRRFVNMAIPQTRRGLGESVTAIDYTGNGLTDFVVMNGLRNHEGLIRLIALEPLGDG